MIIRLQPLCVNCSHWGQFVKSKEQPAQEWAYCYLGDFHNPNKKLFYAEPNDQATDARLQTRHDFGCILFQSKWEEQ